MRKTQKKILGLFGLFLVAAMTVFAASLPSPNALAETTGVVDTIVIRVIGDSPNVYFIDPPSGSFVEPNQTFSFNYEKIEEARISMTHNGTPYSLGTITTSEDSGIWPININLSDYGYGEYTITVVGEGYGGVTDPDTISFSYYPITSTVEQNAENGDPTVILNYDDNNIDIDRIVINVYDEYGNLVGALSPVTVIPDNKNVLLPFAEKNIPAGKYTIATTAYNAGGDPLYQAYDTIFTYKPDVQPAPDDEEDEDIVVPNTGGLFESLNISQSDYLITGLIIFFVVGVGGAIFIAKSKNYKR